MGVYLELLHIHRHLKVEHQISSNVHGANAYRCNKVVKSIGRASVRAIIHSLTLVDDLPVQTHKPYSNYRVYVYRAN